MDNQHSELPESTGDLADNNKSEINLPLPTISIWIIIVAGLIFVGVIVFVTILPTKDEDLWGRIGMVALFGTPFIGLLIIYLVAKASSIVLSDKGICKKSPLGTRFISWDKVNAFFVSASNEDEALVIRGESGGRIKILMSMFNNIMPIITGAHNADFIFQFCYSQISSQAPAKVQDMLTSRKTYDISDKTRALLWGLIAIGSFALVFIGSTIYLTITSGFNLPSAICAILFLIIFSLTFRVRHMGRIVLTADGLRFPSKEREYDWKDIINIEYVGENEYALPSVKIWLADDEKPLIITQRNSNYFVFINFLEQKGLLEPHSEDHCGGGKIQVENRD